MQVVCDCLLPQNPLNLLFFFVSCTLVACNVSLRVVVLQFTVIEVFDLGGTQLSLFHFSFMSVITSASIELNEPKKL